MHLPVCARKLLLTCLIIMGVGSIFAQNPRYSLRSELEYNNKTGITTVRETGKLYTGYEYALYYNKPDTQNVLFIVNGRTEWEKRYSERGKLIQSQVFYQHGFKQDSICFEFFNISEQTGDTTDAYVDYIDKNKVKWRKQINYYSRKETGGRMVIRSVGLARCITRNDTRAWARKSQRRKENFDSLGYCNNFLATGPNITYHKNGKVMVQGQYSLYEYYISHKAKYPPYPWFGMTGVWTYYDTTGRVTGENIYDNEAGIHLEARGYYPDGSYRSRVWFNVLYSQLNIAAPQKVPLLPGDTCYRAEAKWTEDGKLLEVDIDAQNWTEVDYEYYANGNPARFLVQRGEYGFNPIGIRQEWDEQGRTTSFINYSDNTNDTICYVAKNGQISRLNLMSKDSLGKWKGFNAMQIYSDYAHHMLWKMTDVYRAFNEKGVMISEAYMKDGERHGTFREWYDDGTLAVSGNYINGVVDGEWKEFYPDGRARLILHYTNGIRNGTGEEFYANGNLKWKNSYVNGACGKGQAYSESGSLIDAADYAGAFIETACMEKQIHALNTTALHYYFLDTAANPVGLTFGDSMFRAYTRKIVVLSSLLDSGFNYCVANDSMAEANNYKLYRSVFSISPSLYDENGKTKISAFFGRHGIKTDSIVQTSESLTGDSIEYLVYYSSQDILNKKLIADSLDAIVFSEPGSVGNGHIIHLDSYTPQSQLAIPQEYHSSLVSGTGYMTIQLTWYGNYWYNHVNLATSFVIYDDLTVDPPGMHARADRKKFWAQSDYW